jgi:hypothetical protein
VAHATTNASVAGTYAGRYTVVSVTPDPGLPGVPGAPTGATPPPSRGTVTVVCPSGAPCSATIEFVGNVSLTQQSADHYHARMPFDAGFGCVIDTPSTTTLIDLVFSGKNLAVRIVQPAGRYKFCRQSTVNASKSGITRALRGRWWVRR